MIEVMWANPEKNTVLWKFSSNWTWDEFFTAKREVDAMIDGVEGIVDSIFLTSKEQKIPPGAIANFRTIVATRHKRHDLIVVVGSRTFLSAIVNIVFSFVPGALQQLHYVYDEDEAYTIIKKAQQRRREIPSDNQAASV